MDEQVRRASASQAKTAQPCLIDRAKSVAYIAAQAAAAEDADGAFPIRAVTELERTGLLIAPFPVAMGGEDLGRGDPDRLRPVLTALGHGSLALGRLYEGHVNAVVLAVRYGSPANLMLLKAEALVGRLSGVWMAGEPLRFEKTGQDALILRGTKIYCSGAGSIRRPLVAGAHEDKSVMAIPFVDCPERTETSSWTAHGMRATATGSVDFEGIKVTPDEIVGLPGDYLRSPYFRGGVWRVIAVQLGGLKAILDAYGTQLKTSPHAESPIQLARYGEALMACETARLWVAQAARTAEGPFEDSDAVDAYVDLARNAFEQAALSIIALAQKAIGLKAFLRPNPLERLIRDLATYLRQPALDASLLSAARRGLGS